MITQRAFMPLIDDTEFLFAGSQNRREQGKRERGSFFTIQVDRPTNIRQGLRPDTYLTLVEKFDMGQGL